MRLTHTQYEIYRVLKIYSKHWGAGLLPFMRLSDEMPDSSQSYEMWQAEYPNMTESVHVQGGDKTPMAVQIVEGGDRLDSVIRNNGGIELWQDVFDDFKSARLYDWLVLRDISRVGRSIKLPNLTAVADAHNLSIEGLHKIRHRSIKNIACEICDRCVFSGIRKDDEDDKIL